MISNDDTIVALATPSGIGAISVIRLSGSQSFSAIDKIFNGSVKISECKSHTIHYGKIIDREKNLIDDVLISVFRNPTSYTGEDCIEVSTHGSPIIVQKIIELLLQENIRIAEPGEFTKRAFLNGRIDLAQAEAVVDIINSRTETSFRGARNQLDGMLSSKVNSLRNQLINISSLLELELDFTEDDIEIIEKDKLLQKINFLISEIEYLINSYSYGKIIKDGINVAIVGLPNVGKSSLLNYILKEKRAIVSEIPGTTRDIIREDVFINGILFRLYDTAGLRESNDEIEKIGITLSKEVITSSDFVLLIFDIERKSNLELFDELKSYVTSDKIILSLNKIDLIEKEDDKFDVCFSAKTGKGIDKLFNLLKEKALSGSTYSEKSAYVLNVRHKNSLVKAKDFLVSAINSIQCNLSEEFISCELRDAEKALSEIVGDITTDDVLNNIFSNFCIGK